MKLRRSFVAALASLCALPAFAADLDGRWLGKLTTPRGDNDIVVDLKVDGETVTGVVKGAPPSGKPMVVENGKLVGNQLSFTTVGDIRTTDGDFAKLDVSWTATVEGDQLKNGKFEPKPKHNKGKLQSLPWEATKKK